MEYTLIDLETVLRRIGRGTVWLSHDGTPPEIGDPVRWDGDTELNLFQLGDTEGDLTFNPNGTIATLTLPEISGDSIHEATYTGENPDFEANLFLADPDLAAICSPLGSASAGHFRVRDVAEHTIVVFPENMFKLAAGSYANISFSGGVWLLNGSPLSAARQTDLANSLWLWRCYFDRPRRRFLGGHGDAGKNIEPVAIHCMMHPDMPDGDRLYTIGDPSLRGINIEGGS